MKLIDAVKVIMMSLGGLMVLIIALGLVGVLDSEEEVTDTDTELVTNVPSPENIEPTEVTKESSTNIANKKICKAYASKAIPLWLKVADIVEDQVTCLDSGSVRKGRKCYYRFANKLKVLLRNLSTIKKLPQGIELAHKRAMVKFNKLKKVFYIVSKRQLTDAEGRDFAILVPKLLPSFTAINTALRHKCVNYFL